MDGIMKKLMLLVYFCKIILLVASLRYLSVTEMRNLGGTVSLLYLTL